ncbi:MAG: 7,8-didemethyl-8-hydroxy-5-deazariboflavin synthase CofG [Verrucomicrobiota bacterium]
MMEPDLNQAAAIRDRHWGEVVTYSRKVFIPLTNMCRNECGYCVFVKHPPSPEAAFMTPDEVLAVAAEGRRLGCREALFSLGEKPEQRYPEAREALARLGFETTIDYVRAMCGQVLRETGLLPHVNAGTLQPTELETLKPVSGSMGMMLETTSERLMKQGQAHHRCPDKYPARRLETIDHAGELQVPFTTGLLIGIGETWDERIETLEAIQERHQRYGHIQEVIVQNFRAKPGINMEHAPEPGHDDMMNTIAAARRILDPAISLQAPPNLDPDYPDFIDAGINDWGGISPLTKDFINPERAWPQIERLAEHTRLKGKVLKERLRKQFDPTPAISG